MKQPIFALKDTKSFFQPPFVDVNEALAVRHVKNALDSANEFSKNPADFELWKLGEYDNETGIITSKLEHVVNCSSLVKDVIS